MTGGRAYTLSLPFNLFLNLCAYKCLKRLPNETDATFTLIAS